MYRFICIQFPHIYTFISLHVHILIVLHFYLFISKTMQNLSINKNCNEMSPWIHTWFPNQKIKMVIPLILIPSLTCIILLCSTGLLCFFFIPISICCVHSQILSFNPHPFLWILKTTYSEGTRSECSLLVPYFSQGKLRSRVSWDGMWLAGYHSTFSKLPLN